VWKAERGNNDKLNGVTWYKEDGLRDKRSRNVKIFILVAVTGT
jgi:hypothetical protein